MNTPKNKIRKFMVLVMLLTFTSSCGMDNGSGMGDSEIAADLIGSWQNDCSNSSQLESGEGEISFWTFLIMGSFEHTVIQYSDNQCTSGNESIVLSGNGTYTLGDKTMGDTAQQITFSFNNFKATVKNDQLASDFSSENVCGESSWRVDRAVSLYGKTCTNSNDGSSEIFPGTTPIKDLVDIMNHQNMWLGKKNETYSPDAPATLSQVQFYKK